MDEKEFQDLKQQLNESGHRSPTIWQRFKNAIIALGMVIILLQIISFNSYIAWIDHPVFIIGMVICAILGAWKGERFIEAVNKEIGHWKFW